LSDQHYITDVFEKVLLNKQVSQYTVHT